MRENKWKNLAITGIILLSILFLLFFNYYYIFVSPKMIEAKEVKHVVNLFENTNEKQVEFMSRYFSDESYYSATDDEYLYLFNEEGKLIHEEKLVNLDLDRVESLASESLSDHYLSFAMLDDNLVYVLESESMDVFIDVETFETVLTFRKGIDHD